MTKRGLGLVFVVVLLVVGVVAPAALSAPSSRGGAIQVVGEDDPVCETPYRVANPDYEPPYHPNLGYDPSNFLSWKYLVNPLHDPDVSPFLPNLGNVIDCDVERIQAAVDAAFDGDTILLRGTFNLGEGNPRLGIGIDPQTVFVPKDLTIKGAGGDTVIKGGYRVFTVGLEPIDFVYDTAYDHRMLGVTEPTPVSPATVTITGIRFVDPLFAAVWLAATKESGTTRIVGNEFVGGKVMAWTEWFHAPHATAVRLETPAWVNMPGVFDPGCDGTCLFPRMVGGDVRSGTEIKGEIVVSSNVFDGTARLDPNGISPFEYAGVDSTFDGYSHFLYGWFVDADVIASGNTVENFNHSGISFGGYFRDVTITNNHVLTGPSHFVGQGISTVEDGYTRTLFGKTFGEGDRETARTTIQGNRIEVQGNGLGIRPWLSKDAEVTHNTISGSLGLQGERPFVGIVSYAAEATVISHNTLDLENVEWAGISLEDDAYGHLVEHNVVSGSGRAAVNLGWPWFDNSDNTIRYNDFRGFTPIPTPDLWGVTYEGSHVAVIWGAHHNTITDNHYPLVDQANPQLSNIYFTFPFPHAGLSGATDNVVRENGCPKIMDYTDPNGPLYDPDSYAGANDIELGGHGAICIPGPDDGPTFNPVTFDRSERALGLLLESDRQLRLMR